MWTLRYARIFRHIIANSYFRVFLTCHEYGVSLYYIFMLSFEPFVSNNVSQLQGLPTWRGRNSEEEKKGCK